MDESNLKIRFTGQEHQIDANTLINTLIHYNSMITRVNDVYGEGQYEVNVKVSAPERGSFLVDIYINTSLIQKLFSPDIIQYAANISTLFIAAYTIHKTRKGKPIKEFADKKEITQITNTFVNSTIDKRTIIKVYNDSTIRAAISKSIDTASEDLAIEGIELSSEDVSSPPLVIDKKEFQELIYDEFDREDGAEENGIRHKTIPRANLSIMAAAFDGKTKWRFFYDGNKLPAISIKDEAFQNMIDNGKAFAKGDCLVVNLEITQEFNPIYNAYENKKYRVLEVLDHIPRPKQESLF